MLNDNKIIFKTKFSSIIRFIHDVGILSLGFWPNSMFLKYVEWEVAITWSLKERQIL